MSGQGSGTRRGSSLFAASANTDSGDVSGPYGRPAYLYGKHDGDLLVDFPEKADSDMDNEMDMDDSYAYSGGSSSGNSKYSSQYTSTKSSSSNSNNNKARRGEAARMEELADSQSLPGGKDHRPLVGGFAAAAYEAAKAHHYSSRKEPGSTSGIPRDRPPPPSI
ncbi:predicted protein [Chaetoceros tenuissimus]|uniref:Uncharacterized protein n=1 Tax=Chaetoceros tenuissimus TaxID=426638 RepID=A0AAD3CRH8_9STRA|nr:predicted protein [Chaetoceros tenuissimus]